MTEKIKMLGYVPDISGPSWIKRMYSSLPALWQRAETRREASM